MASLLNPDPRATRRSKLRWYLGLVGLLGSFALAVELTSSDVALPWLLWGGAGVPVMVAYLLSALAFERVLHQGKLLFIVLGGAAVWWLALAGLVFWTGGRGELIPVLLFGLVPCLGAMMRLQDVRADLGIE